MDQGLLLGAGGGLLPDFLIVVSSVLVVVPPDVVTLVCVCSPVFSEQPGRTMKVPAINTPANAPLIRFLMRSGLELENLAGSGLA
jgi:hypothetical protein